MNHLLTLCIFFPFIAACISCLLNKKESIRNAFIIGSCFIVFAASLSVVLMQKELSLSILSFNFSSNGFSSIYALITSFMWLCAAMLSPMYFKGHHNTTRYYLFFLMTAGATMGVFLSADLLTTFTFFEIMSFTSYTWVIQERNKESLSAGKTYLTIAVLGGMVCLMGLFLLNSITGTLVISQLSEAISNCGKSTRLYASAFCMLVGFGAKAGLFPLHIWLPKAHPVAPAPASALLSGVLTKTGVFGILVISSKILIGDELWGKTLLILGTITMVLGAVLAVFSVNLKRTLACSSLSQIGFITVGISMLVLLGEENALAANGTVLYMLNHSVVKLVLFLCAGAIYAGAHTLDLNKLRGYGRNKPVILIPFLIGACSLAGIPGTCGYISKTLIHESIVEYAAHAGILIDIVEWLFLFSGGLTAAYMLKLFITIFIEKSDTDKKPKSHLTALSSAALILSAVILPVIGVLPHALGEKISLSMIEFIGGHHFHHEVHYFSFTNLKGVLISLTIGIIVYLFFIRKVLTNKNGHYNPLESRFSVEENIYVPVCGLIIKTAELFALVADRITDHIINIGLKIFTLVARICCDITDIVIVVLSKTAFSTAKEHDEITAHRYSYALGKFIDEHSGHGNNKKHESKADLFVNVSETISQTTSRLFGSFSFALFMTCLGICIILLFLLFTK